jgi:lupus La protein
MSDETSKVEAVAPEAAVAVEPEDSGPATADPQASTDDAPNVADAGDKAEAEADGEASEEKTEEAQDGAREETGANEPKMLKTTAKEDEQDFAKNRKFDASLLPESTDPAEMRKQVIAPPQA